jgi:hypothetical protein
MKALSVFLYLCFSATIALAQQNEPGNNSQQTDTISIIKTFGGTTYYDGRKQLKPKDIRNIVQDNEQALTLVKSANAQSVISGIIAFSGGFMCGYQLGAIISGREPSYGVLAIGAGVIAISIPISISANRDLKRAVRTYNADIQSNHTTTGQYQLRLQSTGNTIGLAFTF